MPGNLLGEGIRLARDHHLLPHGYLYALLFRLRPPEGPPSAFLLERLSTTGWWYYFPVTFALKTPLALILLLAVSVFLLLRGPAGRMDGFVWLPVVLFGALAMLQRLNIGHRHILPIYPFLFVACGRVVPWALAATGRARRVRGALVAGLLVWYAAAAALVHPHYLAYFNELAGGPKRGYRRLVDSSLDWGQDLKGLKAYMDRHHIPTIKLSYFGTADPSYYGIICERLPGFPPRQEMATEVRPGDLLAVSATNLQDLRLEEGRRLMRRLRERQPIDSIGYSILIYRADFAWSLE